MSFLARHRNFIFTVRDTVTTTGLELLDLVSSRILYFFSNVEYRANILALSWSFGWSNESSKLIINPLNMVSAAAYSNAGDDKRSSLHLQSMPSADGKLSRGQ